MDLDKKFKLLKRAILKINYRRQIHLTITVFETPPECILYTSTPKLERRTGLQLGGCPQVLCHCLNIIKV